MSRPVHRDALAIAALVALWLLFFWRLFTPVEADQASLALGDFSGQFVAFAGYQYDRFTQGEIPLWNPYNNAGLPFIADTQAAVFYPPRLVTIALAGISGGWSYHALELEMTLHVLLYTLLMYALLRRMTLREPGSAFGAFIAAVIVGYGGFTAGYPLLQLAILEAGVWLPLAVLGVFEATRARPIRWIWLVVAGFALGLSWLAGHPQTSYFLTLLLVGLIIFRVYLLRARWFVAVVGIGLLALVAFGMAAVQLLPGLEYLNHTARAGFEYEAKGNGFPVQDIVQLVYPGIVSVFSPLYVGIVGLVLALVAVGRRLPGSLFWGLVALLALLWSFGANAPFYPLLYNLLPGLRYFRGQERAAYLVANSLAILAGLGATSLVSYDLAGHAPLLGRVRAVLRWLLAGSFVFAAVVVAAWLGNAASYGTIVAPVVLSTVIIGMLALVLPQAMLHPRQPAYRVALAALLVFELFAVTMNAPAVYDPVPPEQQLSMTPPPALAPVLSDSATPFRVDGFRGLGDNYGSLYGILDMRGISPLFLSGPFALIEPDKINPLAWELFAVRYVPSDWAELPVPSEIVGRGEDRFGPINIHRLADPRPFALLLYDYTTAPGDESAHALLRSGAVDPRLTAILAREPAVELGEAAPDGEVRVTTFEPESFALDVYAPASALLSVAHPHYPGWRATLDGEPAEILRAYGALSALVVPEGRHTIVFAYDPLSYRIGAAISVMTWAALGILVVTFIVSRWRKARPH